ncbi:MAG: ECF transporter S component [Enterococcus sp.]
MERGKLQSLVLVALFTALTVVGTSIMIPLPGAFVHFGNAILLLAVLLIGYVKGVFAGALGFAIFDYSHGYTTEIPYFFLESFVVGAVAYGLFLLFKKNPTKIWQIVVIGIGTGVAKIVMTQIKNTVIGLMVGSQLPQAFTAAFVKLPATLINATSTVIIVALLYFPLRKALQQAFKQRFA